MHEAKTNLSRLVAAVESGEAEEVEIARAGQVVARTPAAAITRCSACSSACGPSRPHTTSPCRSRDPRAIVSVSWVGRRTPLHCTSNGKVLLAHGSIPLPAGELVRQLVNHP